MYVIYHLFIIHFTLLKHLLRSTRAYITIILLLGLILVSEIYVYVSIPQNHSLKKLLDCQIYERNTRKRPVRTLCQTSFLKRLEDKPPLQPSLYSPTYNNFEDLSETEDTHF